MGIHTALENRTKASWFKQDGVRPHRTSAVFVICIYIYIYNKENQNGVNETKNKTLKRYSQSSSRGHREYSIRMTFLVSVSIKLKIQTCPRRHYKERSKKRIFQQTPKNKTIYIYIKNRCMKINKK